MSIDWSVVLRSHVIKACEDCDKREAPEGREAKNTFLPWNGKCYPAKYIRGLAYRRATGVPLDPDRDYSGGKETSDFFQELGFDTEYKGHTIPGLLILDRIDKWYRALQEAYRTWGREQASRDGAIKSLEKMGIKEKPNAQVKFSVFHSAWNPVTIPLVRRNAEGPYKRLQEAFTEEVGSLLNDPNKTRMNLYLLFFIHPVRHELWFYSGHYEGGYVCRLAHEVRSSKRRNLNTAIKLLRDNPARLDDPIVKGCCTAVLKRLLLHPTTAKAGMPDYDCGKLLEAIRGLPAGRTEDLLPSELEVAAGLGKRALDGVSFSDWSHLFGNWAQCAINEGPIFTLRKGRKHVDCFNAVVDVLTRVERKSGREEPCQTQKDLRKILGACYRVRLPEEM